ncbi:MAG TPA: PIG-L family deacetylase [Syntrophales bacterium]|nr:PIG-L family deacetylase [Syntrophales bacterium]HOL59241.1 PIG-L family deacetylase [Syntrophales bacterium]HPO35291.1 PIG-L family deacetylase [Syntrophales bacterium]
MKIVAIGAHPDDIEFGCGGTLARYVEKGHEVFLFVTTQGERGGDGVTRRQEQEEAAKILQAKEVIWGKYVDTEVTPHMNELIHDVEAVIKKFLPDLILVNFPGDTHQDHRTLAEATISATRYVKNVLFYEGPTTQHFSPTLFFDITHTMATKILLLQAHSSQVAKTNIEGLSIIDIAHSTAVFRGIQARVPLAEGFIPLRYLLT